jgi:hypothetical protein
MTNYEKTLFNYYIEHYESLLKLGSALCSKFKLKRDKESFLHDLVFEALLRLFKYKLKKLDLESFRRAMFVNMKLELINSISSSVLNGHFNPKDMEEILYFYKYRPDEQYFENPKMEEYIKIIKGCSFRSVKTYQTLDRVLRNNLKPSEQRNVGMIIKRLSKLITKQLEN